MKLIQHWKKLTPSKQASTYQFNPLLVFVEEAVIIWNDRTYRYEIWAYQERLGNTPHSITPTKLITWLNAMGYNAEDTCDWFDTPLHGNGLASTPA